MNTKELVTLVRDGTLEYQSDPISDQYIVSLMNEASNFAYQHMVKSDDTLFAQKYLLTVNAGQSEYDIPWNAMGKRIEAVFIPSPPNQSQAPWSWQKIRKMDFKQTASFQTTRVRTYYPSVWSTLNNKLYLFPLPLIGYTSQLIISRKLPKMGVYGGKITDFTGNILTVDSINDDTIVDNVSVPSAAFICVTSFKTGEIKAMYAYNVVDDAAGTITLCDPPVGRTTYMGYPVSNAPNGNWGSIELDDGISLGFTSSQPLMSEEFDYFHVNWAVNRIRGVLNESDAEAMNALKLEIQQLTSDLAGRETGFKIERTAYMQASGSFFKVRR